MCRNALIEGKLRGNLQCSEVATINFVGKIPGRLTAQSVTVEKKADVQFFRRVRVSSIDIKGRMSGEIIAETVVRVHKNAILDSKNVRRDPVHWLTETRESPVHDDEITIGHNHSRLILQRWRDAFNEVK